MFYARMAGATLQDLFTSGNGVTVTSITLNANQAPQLMAGPVFPNVLTAPPAAATVSAINLQLTAPNFKTPYSQQATLAVERDLTHGFGLTVSYIWSNGIHLYSVTDLNMPAATTPFTYEIYNEAPTIAGAMQIGSYTTNVTTGVRPNSKFQGIYQDGNAVAMNYNALAIQLHKAFTHGLMADLSYTFSHELDDGQGQGQGTPNMYLYSNSSAARQRLF